MIKKNDHFFFAITSINVTHMLIAYFFLNKDEVSPDLRRVRAGRKQMKRFAFLNQQSKRAFFEIYANVLIYLFSLWMRESAKTKPLMPDFNRIKD
jgi:hypothetical protein